MKRADLVPLKVVVEELCVSKTTLWRASRSNLPGFPKPKLILKVMYWKRSELPQLEDALLQFKGRGVFERNRREARKLEKLKRAAARQPKKRDADRPTSQSDLFDR